MIHSQSDQDHLHIAVNPVWTRGLLLCLLGIGLAALVLRAPNLTVTDLAAAFVLLCACAVFAEQAHNLTLEFHRPSNTLTITRSLFRRTAQRVIPLTAITAVRVLDGEDGDPRGAKHAQGQRPNDLLAPRPRPAKPMIARIITHCPGLPRKLALSLGSNIRAAVSPPAKPRRFSAA